MTDDIQLLRRFAAENSEAAFAELVRQRIDFVYGIALRIVGGDAHLARDVAQSVFLDLAQKARELSRRPVLVSWLYTSTRFAAAKAVRTQARWLNHQQEAHAMQQLLSAGAAPDWEEIRPVLDEAMGELAELDRTAILLRFFEGRPLAQVGGALGVAENTARMRVERALDKLRVGLARRGITSTAAALGTAISQQPVLSAPAGLAAAISGASLASLAAGGAGVTAAVVAGTFMSTTKVVLGIAAVLGLGLYVGATRLAPPSAAEASARALLVRQNSELRKENRSLNTEVERQMARLETPSRSFAEIVAASSPPVPQALTAQEIALVVMINLRQLDAAADQFRLQNGRSPASLDELVGPTKYIKELKPADSESYAGVDLTGGIMTVTASDGQLLRYFGEDANGPSSPEVARKQALEAFRAANGGREPTEQELTPYIADPAYKALHIDGVKSLALRELVGPAVSGAVGKAAKAYEAATGADLPETFEAVLLFAPYIANASDRAAVLEAYVKISAEFGQ